MPRQRPRALLVMGWCCLGFSVLYLGWLLVYDCPRLWELVSAAFGTEEALDSLARQKLTGSAAVFLWRSSPQTRSLSRSKTCA